jgi:hypothetical protein
MDNVARTDDDNDNHDNDVNQSNDAIMNDNEEGFTREVIYCHTTLLLIVDNMVGVDGVGVMH